MLCFGPLMTEVASSTSFVRWNARSFTRNTRRTEEMVIDVPVTRSLPGQRCSSVSWERARHFVVCTRRRPSRRIGLELTGSLRNVELIRVRVASEEMGASCRTDIANGHPRTSRRDPDHRCHGRRASRHLDYPVDPGYHNPWRPSRLHVSGVHLKNTRAPRLLTFVPVSLSTPLPVKW